MNDKDIVMAQTLEAILVQLSQLNDKIDRFSTDLTEFSERFEEVVDRMETERRLDLYGVDG